MGTSLDQMVWGQLLGVDRHLELSATQGTDFLAVVREAWRLMCMQFEGLQQVDRMNRDIGRRVRG